MSWTQILLNSHNALFVDRRQILLSGQQFSTSLIVRLDFCGIHFSIKLCLLAQAQILLKVEKWASHNCHIFIRVILTSMSKTKSLFFRKWVPVHALFRKRVIITIQAIRP